MERGGSRQGRVGRGAAWRGAAARGAMKGGARLSHRLRVAACSTVNGVGKHLVRLLLGCPSRHEEEGQQAESGSRPPHVFAVLRSTW